MNPQSALTSAYLSSVDTRRAAHIAALGRDEVIPLAQIELDRFLALIETLTPAELDLPTDCALWTVRAVIAHQASHVFGLTHWRHTLDQFNPLRLRAYRSRGMSILDAANQRQVDQRADWSLAQLTGEIRTHRADSLAGRQHFPFLLRQMRVGAPGYDGSVSVGELIDSIYTRDMWMHRADLCRATGREMHLTADHDGRINTLIVRDLDRDLRRWLDGRAVLLRLTGRIGGEWVLGAGTAQAAITLDVMTFNRMASGRIPSQQVIDEGQALIDGDPELARLALRHLIALY